MRREQLFLSEIPRENLQNFLEGLSGETLWCCWTNITSPHTADSPSGAEEMPFHAPASTNPLQISWTVSHEWDLKGSFWGPPPHLSKQQAGKAIRLSLIISLFATSRQGKMLFQSFCASPSLWASFTMKTHQQILYFSDSHGFPYWRLMNSFWKPRKSARLTAVRNAFF